MKRKDKSPHYCLFTVFSIGALIAAALHKYRATNAYNRAKSASMKKYSSNGISHLIKMDRFDCF